MRSVREVEVTAVMAETVVVGVDVFPSPILRGQFAVTWVEMKQLASIHMHDLNERIEAAKTINEYNKQHIRIFVTTHKNVDTFDSAIMQPVQVGPKNYRFPWAFHDDEGENIADLNPRYCEPIRL